jgi:hypothetical protein
MKKAAAIVMLVVSIVLCWRLVLVGIDTVLPQGFIDFPCIAYYDEANSCVSQEGPLLAEEDQSEARLQVFLTSSEVGFSGGGCYFEGGASNRVEMETPALDLVFERRGEALFVNGKLLAAGDTFSFTKFWDPNPWLVEKVQFTNYGLVPVCGKDLPERLEVIGTTGNEVSLVKGGLVLLVPLALMVTSIILLVTAAWKKRA